MREIFRVFKTVVVISWMLVNTNAVAMLSIRGALAPQKLPLTFTSSWTTWTFDPAIQELTRVEDASLEDGWVQATTFDKLYLPSDLPPPVATPALGVVIANGSPRYIMPSLLLSLSTPERVWRNRGLNSLPRANAWIDIFAPLAPKIDRLRLSSFGQSVNDVRFLEDIDGAAAWESMLGEGKSENSLASFQRTDDASSLSVDKSLLALKTYLSNNLGSSLDIYQGYHFVDVPIIGASALELPSKKVKMYLTDLDAPKRLLEYESPFDDEPIGELSIDVTPIGAGGTSDFLPEVYRDLYEPGNILFDF